jgi:preprotein translocase subunit SecG
VFNRLKKNSGPNEPSSVLNDRRRRAIPVAVLLIFVVLLAMGSGIYASASYFAQQASNVTVTTTIYTTTTSWVTSTIWSTVTQTVQGVLTTVIYATSTSTVTVTGTPAPSVITVGGSSSYVRYSANYAVAFPITLPSGTVTSIGINFYGGQLGNVRVALYSAGSGTPASLLTQSASTAVSGVSGWQDIAVAPCSVTAGSYWVAFNISSVLPLYYSSGTTCSYYKLFGAFDASWSASSGLGSSYQVNMRVTLS